MSLTQEKLKECVSYNQDTGVFTRIKGGKGSLIGAKCGCIDAYGYRVIGVCGKKYKAHRLAWLYVYGEWPSGVIDHINRNQDDNRIDNLRDCTVAENARNSKRDKRSTSGYKGVIWNEKSGKWVVAIRKNKVLHNFGYFDCPKEANKVAKQKRAELHGDFGFHDEHEEKK